MKLALLADLHANREALSALLEHARTQGAERFAFLGDYVGYGADPGWVVDQVRDHVERGAWAVLGNHDEAAVRGMRPSMSDDARRGVEWTRAQLAPEQLEFLGSLPLTAADEEMLFVHANAFDPAGWAYVEGRSEAARSMHACTPVSYTHLTLPTILRV